MKQFFRRWIARIFQVRWVGCRETLSGRPAVIASNRLSFFNTLILALFLPDNAYFAFHHAAQKRMPFYLRWFRHIRIHPDNPHSLRKVVQLMEQGASVVLFPERLITNNDSLVKLHSSVGFVVYKTAAPVYPVVLSGPEFWQWSGIKHMLRTRQRPYITIHADQPVAPPVVPGKSFKWQKQKINAVIMEALQHSLFRAKYGRQPDNLFDCLLEAAAVHGQHKTIVEDAMGKITYRKAILASCVLADRLRRRLKREQTVGILLPNSIGHMVALFALCYLGKRPAILNFTAGLQNNIDCAGVAGLKTILTSRLFVEKGELQDYVAGLAAHYEIVYLEDVKAAITVKHKLRGLLSYLRGETAMPGLNQIVLFTSGSEGKPKGVVLKHSNFVANLVQLSCVIDYTGEDRMLNVLPIFHAFGLTAGLLLPVLEGLPVYLHPNPLQYKAIPELIAKKKSTILIGTPTFLMGYAKQGAPEQFASLRYVVAGGEKLKAEIRQVWEGKFGIRILEAYGTTETAPGISLNTPLFNRQGTVGKFLPGLEWRLEAVEGIPQGGNLRVKGPNVMAGYLLYDQGFVPAPEWYNCGDVVEVDDDGFITITSRLKRFAKISGEMVSLDAVEQMANHCFGSELNAAINIADGRKGERILLYSAEPTASRQRLREYISQMHGSMLSLPAEVILVDELPLLGTGKINYVALKAQAAEADS